MILVTWNSYTNTYECVGHHSGDTRVCAAISAAHMTCHRHYNAPEPEPGRFRWTIPLSANWDMCLAKKGVEFLRKTAETLAWGYPDQLKYEAIGGR